MTTNTKRKPASRTNGKSATASKRRRAPKSAKTVRKAVKKTAASTRAPAEGSMVRVFDVLPARILEVGYIRRTRDILTKRQRRAARLRADTRKEFAAVVQDLQTDVRTQLERAQDEVKSRVDSSLETIKGTKVGRELEPIPSRVTETFDAWLLRMGLVREARLDDRVRAGLA